MVKQIRKIVWIAVVFLIPLCWGCNRENANFATSSRSKESADQFADGQLVLGSPSLTSGVPGEGHLTQDELTAWLSLAKNHEPIDFVLPKHLQSGEADPQVPTDNPLTRAKIELGRQLFFDKRLSGYGTFSCGICHRPEQSYSSYQVMPEVGRNALPVFNRILGDEQFWDGRAESLEAQPESPIKNPFEMNSTKEKSTSNIAAIPGYQQQFEKIFGEVSFENICKALASFERVLVTGPSAWDRGDLSPAAKRGEELFFSERLSCTECHGGANFTDESFYNLGAHELNDYDDQGRAKVTKDAADSFAFKTPSLRNVAMTPPYMHNGAFRTLEEVIDFFNQGGLGSGESHPLEPLSLTDEEKQDLVEFLKSLSSSLPPVETGRLPK